MRCSALIALVLVAASAAFAATDAEADPVGDPSIASRSAEAAPHKNLVYVELLGKAGPYGIGFERAVTPRLALGAAASYAVIGDRQLATAAPYLHAMVVHSRHHALFAEVGAMVVHSRIPSPVPEWSGSNDTGVGGLAGVGWELSAGRVVLRSYLAAVVGEGGLAPCFGLALGVRP